MPGQLNKQAKPPPMTPHSRATAGGRCRACASLSPCRAFVHISTSKGLAVHARLRVWYVRVCVVCVCVCVVCACVCVLQLMLMSCLLLNRPPPKKKIQAVMYEFSSLGFIGKAFATEALDTLATFFYVSLFNPKVVYTCTLTPNSLPTHNSSHAFTKYRPHVSDLLC